MEGVSPIGGRGPIDHGSPQKPSAEKAQCRYGIDAVKAFIDLFIKEGIISKKEGHELLNQLEHYKQMLDEGKLTPDELVKQLTMEAHHFQSKTHRSLPIFTLASGGHVKSGVLDHINLFEQFVTQAHHMGKLGDDEVTLFKTELKPLWDNVESGQMAPADAMIRLGDQISKVNEKLDTPFPTPPLEAYD